jgi:outer membrane protein assembly factor BamB
MKTIIFMLAVCLLSFSCDSVRDEGEPPYHAIIAWDSGLVINYDESLAVDGDSVFFYERPPGYRVFNIYALTRLDARTGRLVWRSAYLFNNVIFCQPVAAGGYVYVFLDPNVIVCFDRETGEHTATVQVDIENKNLSMNYNVTLYEQHLYFGLWGSYGQYFVRFNIGDISHGGDPEIIQTFVPEILWKVAPIGFVRANPIIHDNIMYVSTVQHFDLDRHCDPVQLAGFDLDTKEMVFHRTFGGSEDGDVPDPEEGGGKDPILIHGDVLYYLGWSVAAWDLKTGERLYRHVFSWNTPAPLNYAPGSRMFQPAYYRGKIYYTSGNSYTPNSYRNIQCIDAATGRLVWNDIAKNSHSLNTNPIIAHDRLYITQYHGLRVYEPHSGRLIGVDKSFCGMNAGLNILYGDYMICVRKNRNGDDTVVAVYVGR